MDAATAPLVARLVEKKATTMPNITSIRTRFDNPFYDTHILGPGESYDFLRSPDLGSKHVTNMTERGSLPWNETYAVLALGLRLPGKSREEEDGIADQFMVTPMLNGQPRGTFPGNLCSTFRMLIEDNNDAMEDSAAGLDASVYLPGYVLLLPLVIPVKMAFHLEVSASTRLRVSQDVRAMVFGLRTTPWTARGSRETRLDW